MIDIIYQNLYWFIFNSHIYNLVELLLVTELTLH